MLGTLKIKCQGQKCCLLSFLWFSGCCYCCFCFDWTSGFNAGNCRIDYYNFKRHIIGYSFWREKKKNRMKRFQLLSLLLWIIILKFFSVDKVLICSPGSLPLPSPHPPPFFPMMWFLYFEDQTMQRLLVGSCIAFWSPGITVPTEGTIFYIHCMLLGNEYEAWTNTMWTHVNLICILSI